MRSMITRLLLRALVAAVILWPTAACSQPQKPENTSGETIEAFGAEGLDQYRGQVVVLNFWAVWCKPCLSEMPDLQAVYEEYQDRGVVIVGLNVTESSEDIAAFAQKNGITFPLFRDVEQQFMKANGINVLPTTLFIDRDGQIQLRLFGTLSKDFVARHIEELLD